MASFRFVDSRFPGVKLEVVADGRSAAIDIANNFLEGTIQAQDPSMRCEVVSYKAETAFGDDVIVLVEAETVSRAELRSMVEQLKEKARIAARGSSSTVDQVEFRAARVIQRIILKEGM